MLSFIEKVALARWRLILGDDSEEQGITTSDLTTEDIKGQPNLKEEQDESKKGAAGKDKKKKVLAKERVKKAPEKEKAVKVQEN